MAGLRRLPGSLVRATGFGGGGFRGRVGIRTRMLAIVLVTSITLLAVGTGTAGYLLFSSLTATVWANLISSTTTPVISMVQSFEEERRLTLLFLEGDPTAADKLVGIRKRSDDALAAVIEKGEAAQRLDPDGSAAELETFRPLYNRVPGMRAAIDTRVVPREEVFAFFTEVIDTIFTASLIAARVAPEASTALELGYGVEPLRAAEALSKADALGVVAVMRGQITPGQLLEFTRHTGEFRAQAVYSAAVLKGERLDQLRAITDSPAWRQLIAVQDAVILRGPVPSRGSANEDSGSDSEQSTRSDTALPLTVPAWQQASQQVNSALLKLWEDQSRDAHATARAEGTTTAATSLAGGIAVLLITGLALTAALLMVNRFVARMRRLRRDTLELADERLPDIMRRLDNGEQVDSAAEVPTLDFGTDELGEVADAFNRAQLAAVSAAVAESRTRSGFRSVFLNIAHRSQVTVHRQLTLLERAERQEENVEQLELLFQLDHLATRARRHAENLIVLGGEKPGRRWRKPIPLWDLIRGAEAESLDYTRIQIGHISDVHIAGQATADLIHLLAELIDNATAFSPPQCQVDISATEVGRGVAVEISDQGLGMTEPEIAERNRLLAEPPDFGVAALTGQTRLGLFVVATLAARHEVSVRLAASESGGLKAIVLIPGPLVETGVPLEAPEPEPALAAAGSKNPPARSNGATAAPALALAAEHVTDQLPAPPAAGTKPPLPRRRRQSAEPDTGERPAVTPPAEPTDRTPEQARDLFAAIEGGTRSGRNERAGNGDRPRPGDADTNGEREP
ncbi:nitrate- and nitrite sensing domain-containing protein [Nocardia sp. NPDC024068]|uniref:sensor histidine kinase n=1 Tax=Nocardia sp. NPDC024068 TaxID=3157197 RepID=UPI0033F37D3B